MYHSIDATTDARQKKRDSALMASVRDAIKKISWNTAIETGVFIPASVSTFLEAVRSLKTIQPQYDSLSNTAAQFFGFMSRFRSSASDRVQFEEASRLLQNQKTIDAVTAELLDIHAYTNLLFMTCVTTLTQGVLMICELANVTPGADTHAAHQLTLFIMDNMNRSIHHTSDKEKTRLFIKYGVENFTAMIPAIIASIPAIVSYPRHVYLSTAFKGHSQASTNDSMLRWLSHHLEWLARSLPSYTDGHQTCIQTLYQNSATLITAIVGPVRDFLSPHQKPNVLSSMSDRLYADLIPEDRVSDAKLVHDEALKEGIMRANYLMEGRLAEQSGKLDYNQIYGHRMQLWDLISRGWLNEETDVQQAEDLFRLVYGRGLYEMAAIDEILNMAADGILTDPSDAQISISMERIGDDIDDDVIIKMKPEAMTLRQLTRYIQLKEAALEVSKTFVAQQAAKYTAYRASGPGIAISGLGMTPKDVKLILSSEEATAPIDALERLANDVKWMQLRLLKYTKKIRGEVVEEALQAIPDIDPKVIADYLSSEHQLTLEGSFAEALFDSAEAIISAVYQVPKYEREISDLYRLRETKFKRLKLVRGFYFAVAIAFVAGACLWTDVFGTGTFFSVAKESFQMYLSAPDSDLLAVTHARDICTAYADMFSEVSLPSGFSLFDASSIVIPAVSWGIRLQRLGVSTVGATKWVGSYAATKVSDTIMSMAGASNPTIRTLGTTIQTVGAFARGTLDAANFIGNTMVRSHQYRQGLFAPAADIANIFTMALYGNYYSSLAGITSRHLAILHATWIGVDLFAVAVSAEIGQWDKESISYSDSMRCGPTLRKHWQFVKPVLGIIGTLAMAEYAAIVGLIALVGGGGVLVSRLARSLFGKSKLDLPGPKTRAELAYEELVRNSAARNKRARKQRVADASTALSSTQEMIRLTSQSISEHKNRVQADKVLAIEAMKISQREGRRIDQNALEKVLTSGETTTLLTIEPRKQATLVLEEEEGEGEEEEEEEETTPEERAARRAEIFNRLVAEAKAMQLAYEQQQQRQNT